MGIYDLEEQEKLDTLKGWWNENGRVVILAIVAFLLTIAGAQGWRIWQQRQAQQAAVLYGQVQEAVRSKEPQKVQEMTSKLLQDHGSSGYAPLAALVAARAAFDAGDLKNARENLSWVTEHAPDEGAKEIARLRLAAVALDDKKYDEALKLLDAKHSEAITGLYAELKGDVLTAQGRVAEARAAYQLALQKLNPGGEYRNLVQLKLDALGETQ